MLIFLCVWPASLLVWVLPDSPKPGEEKDQAIPLLHEKEQEAWAHSCGAPRLTWQQHKTQNNY